MSIQSDKAKEQIAGLLIDEYGSLAFHRPTLQKDLSGTLPQQGIKAFMEYQFMKKRRWRMDYAVPSIMCAIEVQGGNFVKGAHSNPAAQRAQYEKYNAWAQLGGRLWQFMPEQVVRCKVGHKTMQDEFVPVLIQLPWIKSD